MNRFWAAALRFCGVSIVTYFTLYAAILVCPQFEPDSTDDALVVAQKEQLPNDWSSPDDVLNWVKRVGIVPLCVTFSAILLRLVFMPIAMLVVLCIRFWQFRRRLLPIPKWLYSTQALVIYFAMLCYSRPLFWGCTAFIVFITFASLAPMIGFGITCLEAAGLWAAVQQEGVQDFVMPAFLAMEAAISLLLHQHSIGSTVDDVLVAPERFGGLLLLKFVSLTLEGWGVLFIFWTGCTAGVFYLQEQFTDGQTTASQQKQTLSGSTKKYTTGEKAAAVAARRQAGLAAARRMEQSTQHQE